MSDRQLAAFYRDQASRLARYALLVTSPASRLELFEMAATFQRLAMREESLEAEIAANSNIADPADARTGSAR